YSGNELMIDISHFPSGIYLLRHKGLNTKFIKQ
ncbi:MAG: hypothetical protein RIR11_3933, partial [Bacteroidota bacterium]